MRARPPSKARLEVPGEGETTALFYRAPEPMGATLILAHGAGAPQRHPFMVDTARRLAARGIDVVTFDFLYTERGRKLPDRNDTLEACWRAVIAGVRARLGLPTASLFIGGKSMGGRIATQVAIAQEGPPLRGLVLLGFPLHPLGKPAVRRDGHLPSVPVPMLFVQGTRDELGSAKEMERVAARLGSGSRVHAVVGGDHSFALPKRDGEQAQELALEAAADAVERFVRGRLPRLRRPRI